MKDKYEGKTVKIFAPFTDRFLSYLKVTEVIEDKHLYGLIPNTDVYTCYTLSDGIRVEVYKEREAE